jgi:hypothetical protein
MNNLQCKFVSSQLGSDSAVFAKEYHVSDIVPFLMLPIFF